MASRPAYSSSPCGRRNRARASLASAAARPSKSRAASSFKNFCEVVLFIVCSLSCLEEHRKKGLLARRPEFALQIQRLERLQQSALHCEEGGRRAGRRTGLDVDALDVGAGGLSCDAQRLGDLTTGCTAGDQCQHLELS